MPATEEAVQITNGYREHLLAIRQSATAIASHGWNSLDPNDLDQSYATWLRTTVAVVEGAKRQGVSLADGYLAAYVAAERGDSLPEPRGLQADAYLDSEDGRPMDRALLPPLFTVKAAVAAGLGVEQGLRLGRVRAVRTVSVQTMDAPRRALADLLTEDKRVVGWRRVASSGACSACLALMNGETERKRADLHVHPECRCIAEPVVKKVRERIRRPTGREVFDAMSDAELAKRVGQKKAELIRSGDASLDDLVKHEHQTTGPDLITEASLQSLRAK